MRKKTFIISQALLLMGVLALILSGCGTSGTNLAASQKLVYPNIGTADPRTLDPALATDQNSIWALNLINAGLVTLDPKTLKVVPDLASSWDISPDGKTYTFHIRPGLKFSNGDPLTAQDFAYSIDRAFDPAQSGKSYTPTYYLGTIVGGNDRAAGKIPTMIGPGKGLVVVNDTTLQINIVAPALWFLDALSYIVSAPVDKKIVDQYGPTWPDGHYVGTGPFILKSWVHKVKLTFGQNPYWYGTKPTLTEIDMPMIADQDTAWKEWQAKEVDVDPLVPTADYQIAKALGSSKFFEGPYLAIGYVAPNSDVPPFDNVTVRQAFAEATDRDTIANEVLHGAASPSDHIIPQGQPGYNPNLKGLPFNPVDAKAKLTSVYPDPSVLNTMQFTVPGGQKITGITLEYAKLADNDKIAGRLQQDYETYLGVHINLNPVDFGQLLNDTSSKNSAGIFPVQFYLLGWIADYPDPQDWADLVETGNSNNTMNFSNAQADQLIQAGDSSQSPATRQTDYNQAEEIALQNVGWIPFDQLKNIYTFQSWVKGFAVDSQGLISDIAYSDIQILQH